MLPTIATAGVGFVNFGPIGLTAGALGMIDTLSQHYNIYEKLYLTTSFLGWGALSSFETPYHIAEITGVMIGGLLPTGILYPHIDKAIAPVDGAISGYSFMGPNGAGIGFAAGVADECLSQFNITHNYILTSTLKDIATANLFMPQSVRAISYLLPDRLGWVKSNVVDLLKYITNSPAVKDDIALWSFATHMSHDKQKIKLPILQLGDDLYNVYSEIIPPQHLDKMLEKQAIALIAGQVMLAKLQITFIQNNQNVREAFTKLTNTPESWGKFIKFMDDSVAFIFPYVGNMIVSDRLNQYFNTKLYFAISDPMHYELLSGEVSLHLKQPRTENIVISDEEVIQSTVLVDKMNGDIAAISYSTLLPNAISKTISGVYAIGRLSSANAIDTILYSSAYNELTSGLTKILSTKIYSYTNKINSLYSEITSKFNHAKVNADSMIIYGANDFNIAGQMDVIHQIREVEAEQNFWLTLNEFWLNTQGNLDFTFNWLVVADYIHRNIIDHSKRTEVVSMAEIFSSVVGWEAYNIGSISELSKSIDRIIEIKARMAEVKDPLGHQPSYYYTASEQPGICLHNFKVGKGNESRLYIDDLCVMDKVVAVTSASGAGKSTFLKAIKQIMHGGVWSEGDITYYTRHGGAPSIKMTSQETYVVPGDSLLEHITFKKGAAAEPYRARVIELLTKLKIDNAIDKQTSLIANLDVKKDWAESTSGGQKQKIDAVRLMLLEEKPDIIIFDEILAGQDHKSIHTLQALLAEEFPYSQIYVVDHEALSHNSEGFYDNTLHLSNGTAHLIGAPEFG